jgi:hypothetical protein
VSNRLHSMFKAVVRREACRQVCGNPDRVIGVEVDYRMCKARWGAMPESVPMLSECVSSVGWAMDAVRQAVAGAAGRRP